ncbi:sugar phosphate isomerase/epimerase [uncultured Hoeflea sp.]|uniref:sugar phosphate isomerase/epimerase family protein n=1 Tax=uncultured Hoeflea sp. TaxID=538666 RepID=UPI0030D7D3BC
MAGRRIACQTFTWEMLGNGWTGGPDDLVEAIATAGYAGIEITDTMIGHYADQPEAFARRLDEAGLALAAFAYGSHGGFSEADQAEADYEACRKWAGFAAHFQGAMLSMGSATAMSDGARADKIALASDIYNRSAEIARSVGVSLALHPSSHTNTLLYDKADYDQIFSLLDKDIGWVPDTGHILRAGQDISLTLGDFGDRIRYLHLKDVDAGGNWTMLGEGICDLTAVLATVEKAPRFNGWIVVEEESEEAGKDPAAAVRRNFGTISALAQN